MLPDSSSRRCPRCGDADVRPSHRQVPFLIILGLRYYRCLGCYKRFLGDGGRGRRGAHHARATGTRTPDSREPDPRPAGALVTRLSRHLRIIRRQQEGGDEGTLAVLGSCFGTALAVGAAAETRLRIVPPDGSVFASHQRFDVRVEATGAGGTAPAGLRVPPGRPRRHGRERGNGWAAASANFLRRGLAFEAAGTHVIAAETADGGGRAEVRITVEAGMLPARRRCARARQTSSSSSATAWAPPTARRPVLSPAAS